MTLERVAQRTKVLSFAVAAQNHHQLALRTQAVDSGHSGTNVRAFAVVKVFDVIEHSHRRQAVWLAGVFAQAVQHLRQTVATRTGQRQRSQCIQGVVSSAYAQRIGWH